MYLHTIVHSLEVIHKRENILVAHRYALQHSDLVAHHVLAPSHEALVDDFGGIVSAGIDMHAFFYHTIGSCAERLPSLVAAWLYLRLRGCCHGGLTVGSRSQGSGSFAQSGSYMIEPDQGERLRELYFEAMLECDLKDCV